MNIAIITGASSGMGREFVRTLDTGLYTVDEFWLIARREDKLKELASAMEHAARILPLDLSLENDIESFSRLLEAERPTVRILINCAGYGIIGEAADIDQPEQTGMIDLNCRALTQITCACIPYMKQKSRIIQLASAAAFLPQPRFAVYAASKAYVLSFSRALAEELRPRQIYVTAVCPGPVRTEFFDRAEKGGASTLALKKYAMVEASCVVRKALTDSARGRTMSVCSPIMKLCHAAASLLPHSLILRLLRAVQK